MKKVQKNIWNLFIVLTVISLLGLLSLLYLEFKHTLKKVAFELETSVQLVANNISYKFTEEELLLTTIGKELLNNNRTKVQKQKYLDEMLKKNPSLAGFGLIDTKGNFLVTSSNIHLAKNEVLLKDKLHTYYFNKTLNSEQMVLGATRYFSALGKWIIPIRKAIRNENNEVIAVMTAGIVNENNQNFIDQLHLLSKYNILIVKEANDKGEYFRQYMSGLKSFSEEFLYFEPLDMDSVDAIKNILSSKYKVDVLEVKNKQLIVSFKSQNMFGDEQYMAMTYNKKYKLWTFVQQDYKEIQGLLLRSAFIYISIFIAVFILLFWLFKRVAKAEKKNQKELIYQAEHDELTKLPSRKYMYKYIDTWRDKNNEEFYLLYMDLDNFKNMNDKFGHMMGDKILREVAKRLMDFFSPSDMIIRQGGDEFIIFVTAKHKNKLDILCKSLITRISEVYTIDKSEFRIGVSLGISTYPTDSKEFDELLSFADTAMCKAKEHRNSYSFFSEEMRHENVLRSDIEHELRAALLNEEFFMMYQPQIDTQGKLCGVESLVRWNNKTLGLVSPVTFIEIAEHNGMMDEIGDFIIQKSLHEIKEVQDKLQREFTLSINISVVQFMEDNFLAKLIKAVEEENFNKRLLMLEVTESLSISDFGKIVPLLESIKQEGIEISLDDFGTGYSSLSILKKLPINELKIDKSFIDEIVYDLGERKLVQSIIEIGKNFEMKTLAEGVENKEQLDILKSMGCDIIQGYYYSKPLTPEQLTQYLQKESI